jgi:hypothetical protein
MKATSPYDATLLRSGAVILLALALALSNSDLFAQMENPKKLVGKTRDPITRTGKHTGNQPSPVGTAFGSWDGNPGVFFSPAMLDSVIWVGPVCALPTSKDSVFGSSIWNGDPALVVLGIQGPLVFGATVGNRCLFSDSSDNSNSISGLIQPFINYALPGGWYVNVVPISAEEMCCGKHLIVPIGPCVGKVHCFGKLPVNMQLGAYYNSEKSEDGPSWQFRFQLQFQFPQ